MDPRGDDARRVLGMVALTHSSRKGISSLGYCMQKRQTSSIEIPLPTTLARYFAIQVLDKSSETLQAPE